MKFALLLSLLLLHHSKENLDVPEGKIIGGMSCQIADNPFMISLKSIFGLKHVCGGTLISSAWVLTAAHCVYHHQAQPGSLMVVAGETYTYSRYESLQWSEIYRIVIHDKFNNPIRLANDIAVLRLNRLIWQTASIRYVTLPVVKHEGDLDQECKTALITGWGRQRSNTLNTSVWFKTERYSSSQLQCGFVAVLTQAECNQRYPDPIEDTAICAVEVRGNPCFGDSGGPLLCNNVQYGIVSAGYGCSPQFPSIYTRVDKFLDFIWDKASSSVKEIFLLSFLSTTLIAVSYALLLLHIPP